MTLRRAQSAMEYLMTYGWAILIIAVAIAALFSLGVFNSNSAVGNSCISTPGFLCGTPILNSEGLLSFQFGQSTGYPIYNIELACASVANSLGTGQGANSIAWAVIEENGTANTSVSGASIVNALTLNTGSQVPITILPCYSATGATLANSAIQIGQGYSGNLWINYSQTKCEQTPCLWVTAKIAGVTLKVV